MLADKQGALTELSTALGKRLADWAHPDTLLKLEWRQDQDKSVRVEDPLAQIIAGESGFEGNLARFGHGLQRSYLLALLQELASGDDAASPKLVLGCEEPELYQHPPQARHLAEVLNKLSTKNAQVIICTHSPYFVTGQNFESVRMVRKPRGATASRVAFVKLDKLAASLATAWGNAIPPSAAGVLAKIHQELQPSINEIFFTPALIIVEGLEDIAYITTYLQLTDMWKDYRRLGCHLVPANKKSHITQPLAVANELGIPTFVVFDSDAHEPNAGNRAKHERDNKAILTLCDSPGAVTMPADNFWSARCVMWKSEMGELIQQDFDPKELAAFKDKARLHCGHVGGLDKNTLFIADFLTEAWNAGKKSPTLEKLCAEIIAFAKRANTSA